MSEGGDRAGPAIEVFVVPDVQDRGSLQDWIEANDGVVTLVFTDIVRSTLLLFEAETVGFMRIIAAHRRRAKEVVGSLGGRVIDMAGDGVFAAFRDPADGFRFAQAIAENPGHERLQIRVGIHHGAAHANGDDLFGRAVYHTNRVMEQAKEPEVWASDSAKLALEAASPELAGEICWSGWEDREFDGVPGRHRIWRVG